MDWGTLLFLILFFAFLAFLGMIFVFPRHVFYKKKYALERGGERRLEVKWRGDHRNIFIYLDSKEVALIEFSRGEQIKGQSITLPDGSLLEVKLNLDIESKRVVLAPDLTLNGKPVPGSIKDPGYKLDAAVKEFYWGGTINILSGVFVFIAPDVAWYYFLIVIPTGITAFLVGFYLKRLSRTALKVGIGLATFSAITFLAVFLATLSANTGQGICGDLFDLADTYLFIDGLRKGSKAIDYLENERREIKNLVSD